MSPSPRRTRSSREEVVQLDVSTTKSENFEQVEINDSLNTSTDGSPRKDHKKTRSPASDKKSNSDLPASKIYYPAPCDKKSQSSDELETPGKICLVVFLVAILFAGLWRYFSSDCTGCGSSSSSSSLQNEIDGLARNLRLPTSDRNNLLSSYSEMINDKRPVVVMILTKSDTEKQHTKCFLDQQIKVFHKYFKPNDPNPVRPINVASLIKEIEEKCQEQDIDSCTGNEILDKFQSSLQNTGVLWLQGIENFNSHPGLIVSLNSLADHYDARIRHAQIFLTASIPPDEFDGARQYFKKYWTKNSHNCPVGSANCLTVDNFNAIWTRIGDFVMNSAVLSKCE